MLVPALVVVIAFLVLRTVFQVMKTVVLIAILGAVLFAVTRQGGFAFPGAPGASPAASAAGTKDCPALVATAAESSTLQARLERIAGAQAQATTSGQAVAVHETITDADLAILAGKNQDAGGGFSFRLTGAHFDPKGLCLVAALKTPLGEVNLSTRATIAAHDGQLAVELTEAKVSGFDVPAGVREQIAAALRNAVQPSTVTGGKITVDTVVLQDGSAVLGITARP